MKMSGKDSLRPHGCEVYLEQINIELFNDVIEFVMATTASDTSPVRRSLTNRHLWYNQSKNENIQAQYGFRYFGELLERFEDKAGSDIKNIRAIALAMACVKDLLTDDMFVGNQKVNFLRKITRISADDVYLKGALYLINRFEPTADAIFEELTQTAYNHTEEVIFVASLFDDFAQAFEALRVQLVALLGIERTMSVYGNTNVYSWLIREIHHYYTEKGIRSKDMALLRALIELPVAFIKPGSRYYSVLLDNGYTAEEIVYLNSAILDLRPISKTIYSNTIVAEKIAVEFCKTFINSDSTHHPEAYEHLTECLTRYDSFHIKINGHQGIFDAIEHEIRIENPQTFIRLYRVIKQKHIFRFDILDEKWDVLSRELGDEEYVSLFETQLLRNESQDESQIRAQIQRYDTLTGNSYVLRFEKEHDSYKDNLFDLLVEKDIVNLKSAFESCPNLETIREDSPDKIKPPMLLYLRAFIKGVRNRKSFDFFQFLLKEYSFADMLRWFADSSSYWAHKWFFEEPFYKGPASYYSDRGQRFDIKRPFLSEDEQRELFGWLDDYMYRYKADKYIEFAVLMLLDPFVPTLYPQSELRRIYDMVSGINHKIVTENCKELKQKYLSEDELQAERDAEKARAQEQSRQAHIKQLQGLRDELSGLYNGTFESLLKFLDRHKYSFCNDKDAVIIATEYLEMTLKEKNYLLDTVEIGRFLQFGGKLLKKGIVTYGELKTHITKVEEESENAENSGTAESDPDAE